MRRTVQLAGGIEQLFGTLDENLKLLESTLHVATHLKDNRLEVEGESAQVDRAVRILDEYTQLVREGRVLDNGDVKDLFRVATEEPGVTLRQVLDGSGARTTGPGRARVFGKKH